MMSDVILEHQFEAIEHQFVEHTFPCTRTYVPRAPQAPRLSKLGAANKLQLEAASRLRRKLELGCARAQMYDV